MYKLIRILFLLLVVTKSFAQIGSTSPYSIFLLGEQHGNVISKYAAMGGGSTALNSTNTINPFNPATYSFINSNSFLLSTGIRHNILNLENSTESQLNQTTLFSHFIFAFPLTKKIGASVGLLPYSDVGYDVNTFDQDYDAEMIYSGDGGLTKLYFGSSYMINNNLSFGVNGSYLFGRLNKRKKIIFSDDLILNSRSNASLNLKGFYYEIGLLYSKDLNENKKYSLGLVFNNDTEISSTKTEIVETFEYSGQIENVKDTFVITENSGYTLLPRSVSSGFSYKSNNILFLIDYSTQNWSDFEIFGSKENYYNSQRFSSGIEYNFKQSEIDNFLKKLVYRFGFSYYESPLQISNLMLNETSVTFGLGIPNYKSRTKYDISVIYTSRGDTENSLIKEQFLKIGLNISYDGIWFVKRKYD
jgi:hypothetical protein|tara:strand:+ start:118419 stop:119666 length:1248 start_codon:yes stop_codon:yes gene_type:complete